MRTFSTSKCLIILLATNICEKLITDITTFNSKAFKNCGLYFGLKTGFSLCRRSSSLEDLFPLNEHLKASHDDGDNSQEVTLIRIFFFDILEMIDNEDDVLHQQDLGQINQEDDGSPLDDNGHLSDEAYNPEQDNDLKLDLTVSHHGQKKGRYDLVEELDDSEEDDDTASIEYEDPWIVESLNVSEECGIYTVEP
ncbi:hypothetical protein K501DRAFT_267913 [Backusella circina FSU 941]|nr:hypothetical protein K501DRAFT_267913 [Backusella circina FSU 941]